MNRSSRSYMGVSPLCRPPSPVCLHGYFEGEEGDLLCDLRDQLPACGVWVFDSRPGARCVIGLRFEVLVRSAWQLYALLLSLGLVLTPASHRELCLFCLICQNRDSLEIGAVVAMTLEVSCAPLPREYIKGWKACSS